MIFFILCIEEDKFIPEFKPPGIKVEDVYFKRERYLELEIGIGNNLDMVNFSRVNGNYIYGIYIRKKFLNENLKYNFDKFYGELKVIGETMNPFFISKNRFILEKISSIFEFGFSGYKDSFDVFSNIDVIVPSGKFLIGFTGGYRKSIFSGMFLQIDKKRLTLGKDLFEIILFSDIWFLSLRYSYDELPFYDFWFKSDYHFSPITSLELLYGYYYLKAGFIKNNPFFYFNIRNSEFYIYENKIGVSIYYSLKNRFFTIRLLCNNSTDFKSLKGFFGIFFIPYSRNSPFIGGIYNLDNYWRIFAGIKFK